MRKLHPLTLFRLSSFTLPSQHPVLFAHFLYFLRALLLSFHLTFLSFSSPLITSSVTFQVIEPVDGLFKFFVVTQAHVAKIVANVG